MGLLLNITIKEASRSPIQKLDCAQVTSLTGVSSDFRGRPGKRQVTVLSREAWKAVCDELGHPLPWQTRRANLYIEGIDLHQTTGQILQIGQLQLQITQETDPCQRMKEVSDGLFEAMTKEWRGGVCCQVIQDGEIHIGDRVEILRSTMICSGG